MGMGMRRYPWIQVIEEFEVTYSDLRYLGVLFRAQKV